ncbi:hypothetical protein Fmac_024500 [Flemingia macrophylla]|uniref:NADH dehydrogenase subunit 6 n=1 Tax=Flemingia macrophylla TaxID=520843 RepID=A0ABD1LPK1_9FABA
MMFSHMSCWICTSKRLALFFVVAITNTIAFIHGNTSGFAPFFVVVVVPITPIILGTIVIILLKRISITIGTIIAFMAFMVVVLSIAIMTIIIVLLNHRNFNGVELFFVGVVTVTISIIVIIMIEGTPNWLASFFVATVVTITISTIIFVMHGTSHRLVLTITIRNIIFVIPNGIFNWFATSITISSTIIITIIMVTSKWLGHIFVAIISTVIKGTCTSNWFVASVVAIAT